MSEPTTPASEPVAAVPVERLRAMIRLLWPDEITPIAKRQLESLCDAAHENAGIPLMSPDTPHPSPPYESGFLWPPMTRWDTSSVEFERQTVIMDALPHAATVGKMDNWRAAADEFLRSLTQAGWRVVPADSASSEQS